MSGKRKSQDYASLPEYARMSDTVDALTEKKQTVKQQKKTRKERKIEKKETKARKKSEKALRKKAKTLIIPKTAQQTIPYFRVYPESGVIETKPGTFSKGYLLQDINYTSAKDEEQTDIFLKFAEFMNTFDPTTKFQFVISQQNLNLDQFESEAMMPLCADGHDELREESNEEIRTKIRVGRNNLIKNKYLFISRTEESYEAALTSFSRLDGEIVQNFKRVGGAVAEPMTSAKRLELLHDIYNPDSVGLFGNNMIYDTNGKLVFSPENFSFDILRRMGLSTKDMVAPESFSFRADYGMVGSQYFRALYMKTYPQSIRDTILKSLTDIDCKVVVSIIYDPINPEDALRMAKNDIVNVNSNLIEKQKTASKSGYSVDLINPELKSAAEEANNLRSDLTEKSQKLFYQTLVIVHFADNKEKLDSDTKTIQGIGRGYLVDIRPLRYQQENGLNTCLPLCSSKLEIRRSLITESAAVFMPLDNQELYDPVGGIFYGINEGSKNLVMANRTHLKNGNGIVIGSPGSGKSMAAKSEMIQVNLRNPNDVVIVVDPEGEYRPLADLLDGEVIRIAPGSGVHLNPFDIELDTEEDNPIAQKSDFIKALMQTIIGGDDERQGSVLTAAAASIIDRCVQRVYEPYLQSYDVETGTYNQEALPTLMDFYYMLRDQEGYDAMQLADSLEMYTTGTLNFFAYHTNVEYSKRFVVYDIMDIGSSMKNIGMQIVLNNVWNRIIAGRRQGNHVWFYVDEFHIMLSNNRSAEFLNTMFKRARKYGGIPTGITQNITDIVEHPTAKTIFANSEFMQVFSAKAAECALLGDLLDISQSDIDKVKDALPGHGIMLYGGRVIAVNSEISKDSIRYRAMTTKLDEMKQREDAKTQTIGSRNLSENASPPALEDLPEVIQPVESQPDPLPEPKPKAKGRKKTEAKAGTEQGKKTGKKKTTPKTGPGPGKPEDRGD